MPTANRAKASAIRTKRSSGMPSRSADPSHAAEDRVGVLLALPDDPSTMEVHRLTREFGIRGAVHVTTYTGADIENIGMSLLEGDPVYSVTRYPRDMNAFFARLAEQLFVRLGHRLLADDRAKRA